MNETEPSAAPPEASRAPEAPQAPALPRPLRGAAAGGTGEPGDLRNLSLPSRLLVALAVAAVAVAVAVHLAMVFLHVAPSNTVTQQYGAAVDDYVYPEFEQNWKLFAPNPLQQNIHVEARAEVRDGDGRVRLSNWHDLTAEDIDAIRHNVAPSHTQQNELRRAWGFYVGSHDDDNKPDGERGELSELYIRRIVEQRYLPQVVGGDVERIQVRAATKPVAAPSWSSEKTITTTSYKVLPWWTADTDSDSDSVSAAETDTDTETDTETDTVSGRQGTEDGS